MVGKMKCGHKCRVLIVAVSVFLFIAFLAYIYPVVINVPFA